MKVRKLRRKRRPAVRQKHRRRLNATPRSDAERRSLVVRLRKILGPEDERVAEKLATILTETLRELRAQRESIGHDPSARKDLEAAYRQLSRFYEFWRKHPKLERSVPRADPEETQPIARQISEILRTINAAISRLPKGKGRKGSEEVIRRWLSLAIVSALQTPEIHVTKNATGKALLILEVTCQMMNLPRLKQKQLSGYIRTGSDWARKL